MAGPTAARALAGRLALSMVVAGCLVACTSGAGSPGTLPAVTPHPTTSTVTTPSPTPSTDEAAIEAAVRSYYDAMDQAAKTGDVGAFEAASLPTCPCRDFSDAVVKRFADGRLVGAGVVLDEVNVKLTGSKRAVATVVYRTAPYVAESDSGATKSFDASEVKSSLVLISSPSGWLVQAEHVVERT